jgi:hypothetical protein
MNRWYQRRYWVYGGLIGVLVLDVVVYVSWLRRPLMLPGTGPARLQALEKEVAEHQSEVTRLERIRSQVPHLQPQLEGFATEHIPSEQVGFSGVALDLQEAASQAGVALESVSYKTEADRQQVDLLRVAVNATLAGGYPNLLRYLEGLERSPHFYLIDGLEVVGTQRGHLQLKMELITYFRRGVS